MHFSSSNSVLFHKCLLFISSISCYLLNFFTLLYFSFPFSSFPLFPNVKVNRKIIVVLMIFCFLYDGLIIFINHYICIIIKIFSILKHFTLFFLYYNNDIIFPHSLSSFPYLLDFMLTKAYWWESFCFKYVFFSVLQALPSYALPQSSEPNIS